ncbi:hypothetical protein C7959_11143 [Orenia marismortui]|uniref:YjcZ family sporulation protein n=1 Tax=Orenia marismortui TaxID=46469 RepID=A0A4R8GYM2_9FIRM|nr:hypothetical protein C7959_11143 [Orenia marismortui]
MGDYGKCGYDGSVAIVLFLILILLVLGVYGGYC